MNPRIKIILIILTAILLSCNSKNDSNNSSNIHGVTFEKGNIKITNAWIRPAAAGMNTALFFNVSNNSNLPDTLILAESDLAEIVEIHETYKKGDDMMGMRNVDQVIIPANSVFEFKPMHHHIMLIKLKNDLKVDTSGSVRLELKTAGGIKITAKVADRKMMKH